MAAIAAAACRVMTARGVRLTQVADVAREAGVASGTIYLYAADKNALVELALLHAARRDLPAADAPPLVSDAERFAATTQAAIADRLVWPVLDAALTEPCTAETLTRILAEAYDMLDRERRLIVFLDRCAAELEPLRRAYHEGARARFLSGFETVIRRLVAAGEVRADLEPAAAARATLEMLAWMAMRRPVDPLPPACSEAEARAASLAVAAAGLAAARRS